MSAITGQLLQEDMVGPVRVGIRGHDEGIQAVTFRAFLARQLHGSH
jgi:hypothetical protein